MTLSASSALHYWSARYGAVPIIGGKPNHTRSTAGSVPDQRGVLYNAILNTPRFRWNSVASERRQTLRLEQARTNSFLYSEQLGNAAWTSAGLNAIRSDVTIAPDGNLTADLIEENTANSEHNIEPAAFPATTANTLQTWSVFAKARERTFLRMSTVNKANTVIHSWANLTTGAFGTVGAGHTTRVEAFGNGWYRFSITFDSGTGGVTMRTVCATATADAGPFTFVGIASSGLYLWGMQFEVDKACPSSYVATTAATATRSADALYWNHNPVPQAMMAYVRFVEAGTIKLGGTVVLSFSDAANAAPEFLVYNSGSAYTAYHNNGSTAVSSTVATAPVIGDTVELLAVLYGSGNVQLVQSINGGAVDIAVASAANALAAAWADTKLWLNSSGTGFSGLGNFAELKVVRFADVAAGSFAAAMTELAGYELGPNGDLLSAGS